MKTTTKTDARETYRTHFRQANQIMKRIEAAMDHHSDKYETDTMNWMRVAEMGRLAQVLAQAEGVILGFGSNG